MANDRKKNSLTKQKVLVLCDNIVGDESYRLGTLYQIIEELEYLILIQSKLISYLLNTLSSISLLDCKKLKCDVELAECSTSTLGYAIRNLRLKIKNNIGRIISLRERLMIQ